MFTVHSQDGRHFLGLRKSRHGPYEIVYDGGQSHKRFVWQIKNEEIDTDDIHKKMDDAIKKNDVLTALYAGLRNARIDFDIELHRT